MTSRRAESLGLSARGLTLLLALSSLPLALSAGCRAANEPAARPNVLLVTIDTFRADRLGPATPTFTDVSPSHLFYRYIEALAAAGVTAGCGGGNYCPDAAVTRGQMAVFMARALGLFWPN